MKELAIIPARSGSKGLPDKNIKELLGKPLMAYSIEWCGKIDESLSLEGFHTRDDSGRRQQMTGTYRPNGYIYRFGAGTSKGQIFIQKRIVCVHYAADQIS